MTKEKRNTVDDIILLNGTQIKELLDGNEKEIIDMVKEVYRMHSNGESSLPQSSFLQFPKRKEDRIIALPAYIGGSFDVAGIKWISSFPENINHGMERASAVMVLNSLENGRVKAIMESSVISAKRTGAGAAAAADCLLGESSISGVGMIGCGYINFETFRFLNIVRNNVSNVFVYDLDRKRAEEFVHQCAKFNRQVKFIIANNLNEVLQECELISFATTSSVPYVDDLSACKKNCVILHTSLRDLSADVIVLADNVVDDIEHVCRARTSVHLAEQKVGNRDFIRCSIGDIYNLKAKPRERDGIIVYSPFGLGVLDIALGNYVLNQAIKQDIGMVIKSFFPENWMKK